MIPGVDHQTPTWRALKKDITARIAVLQLHLEGMSEPDYTNMLRGSIKELRVLIERVEPPAAEPKNTETTGPRY